MFKLLEKYLGDIGKKHLLFEKCKYLISIFLSRCHFFHRRSISVIESKMFICSSFEAVGTHLPLSLLTNKPAASPQLILCHHCLTGHSATVAGLVAVGRGVARGGVVAGTTDLLTNITTLNTLPPGKDKYEIGLLFNSFKWLNQTKICSRTQDFLYAISQCMLTIHYLFKDVCYVN